MVDIGSYLKQYGFKYNNFIGKSRIIKVVANKHEIVKDQDYTFNIIISFDIFNLTIDDIQNLLKKTIKLRSKDGSKYLCLIVNIDVNNTDDKLKLIGRTIRI